MRRWLTLAEIADAGLPGLPSTRRGLAEKARRNGWAARPGLARERRGMGGGLEYSIDLLPEEARVAWIARHTPGSGATPALPLREDDSLAGKDRNRRDARLWVLNTCAAWGAANAIKPRAAEPLFTEAYRAGAIEVPDWVRAHVPSVSDRQLRRWRRLRDAAGDDALGRDGRAKPPMLDTALDGRVRMVCLGVLASKPFVTAHHLRAYIRKSFGAELDKLPSLRAVQYTIAWWEREYRNELLRLRDPDRYRSHVAFRATGTTIAAELNDLWEIDASPADVMLRGKKRHSVYLAIDVWSRRVRVLVSETPRASAVGLLIRKCLLDWGVPNTVKTDNGSDFRARTTVKLLSALQIETRVSAAYDPSDKGMVERVIGTFQRDLATCPGFIGHSVSDRKVIESRKAFAQRLGTDDEELFQVEMDLAEFQAWCDDWADTIYGTRPHSALGNVSPMLRATQWTGSVRAISNPDALNVLLAPIASGDGLRRVTASGVRVNGHHYQTGDVMPGSDVLVRMDPLDLGRIWLFEPEGEVWLGEAICWQLAGLDPVSTTRKVKEAQKAYEAERVAEIRKAARQIGPRDVADALLEEGRERARNIVTLPPRQKSHDTPGLTAAGDAAASRDTAPAAISPDLESRRAAHIARFRPENTPKVSTEKPIERFRRALGLEEAVAEGREIDPADDAWLQVYQTQPEYRAHKRTWQTYGRQMFA
ncbi:MAG: DDE-type integrase/transposase/recombinase [Natronohydrobacter sp.]|nr:DDE-type integrase/transposase/recombinase [Natronohydrobacter sp.]